MSFDDSDESLRRIDRDDDRQTMMGIEADSDYEEVTSEYDSCYSSGTSVESECSWGETDGDC